MNTEYVSSYIQPISTLPNSSTVTEGVVEWYCTGTGIVVWRQNKRYKCIQPEISLTARERRPANSFAIMSLKRVYFLPILTTRKEKKIGLWKNEDVEIAALYSNFL